MHRLMLSLAAFLAASVATFAQTQASLAPTDKPTPAPVAGPAASAKLPSDTLTLSEAKTFLQNHEAEKLKVEAARKAVFKQGAKATPAERAKLIGAFRVAQKERMEKLQADAPRARELTEKVQVAEKAAPPVTPTPAPKS